MKKVIKLEGRVKFSGSGAFNCDGEFAGDTANVYKWTKNINKNVVYCKKMLVGDGFKYKISSEAINQAVFGSCTFNQCTKFREMYLSHLADPYILAKGYLYTKQDGDSAHEGHRKGGYELFPLVANMDPIKHVPFETKTMSGIKKTDGAGKDNTLYAVENVGEYTYEGRFMFSIPDMQIVYVDGGHQKMAVEFKNDYDMDYYFTCLSKNFNTSVDKTWIKPYYRVGNHTGNKEVDMGFMLTDDMINQQVRYILSQFIMFNGERHSNGSIDFLGMDLTIHYEDNTKDVLENITLKDVENINFEYKKFYNEASLEDYAPYNNACSDTANKKAKNNKKEK
jgi:hypothetical protein